MKSEGSVFEQSEDSPREFAREIPDTGATYTAPQNDGTHTTVVSHCTPVPVGITTVWCAVCMIAIAEFGGHMWPTLPD